MKYEVFIKDDVAYVVIPETSDTIRVQPVMTKEAFIACHDKWIKQGERKDEAIEAGAAYEQKAYNKGYADGMAEKRQARWKGAGMGDYMCSLCATVVSGNRYHYCPNCGASMDESEAEE